MSTYNGHKNWNYWNVSLWIANDESLYRLALQLKREAGNAAKAAELFISELRSGGITETPDGAPYTKTAAAAAIRGL
jgi:hypothetical protein